MMNVDLTYQYIFCVLKQNQRKFSRLVYSVHVTQFVYVGYGHDST